MLKTSTKDRVTEKVEHMCGGTGYIVKEALISAEQRGSHCNLFGRVTIPAGGEIGHHEHHGEAETYYIIEGEGIYEEDGEGVLVGPGDVTYCGDGHGHGLKNMGEKDLVIVAMILVN